MSYFWIRRINLLIAGKFQEAGITSIAVERCSYTVTFNIGSQK